MEYTDQGYGISDTFKELYSVAGKTNVIALISSFFLFTFCIIRELDLLFAGASPGDYFAWYLNYSPAIWSFCVCLLLYALVLPLIRIRKLPYGRRISNIAWAFFIALFIFLICSSFMRINLGNEANKYLPVVIAIVTVLTAITGWFVNHQIAAHNNRVNHTLNLLLQQRISAVFQENIYNVNLLYPSKKHKIIPSEDIKEWIEHEPNVADKNDDAEKSEALIDKKCTAISSQNYLLNYYEFLAVGIGSGLLDEELLYQTIGGIIISQVERSEQLINFSRGKSPKTFEHLMRLHKRWHARRNYELGRT